MKYARYITKPDLNKVDTDYVRRLVDDIYRAHEERRTIMSTPTGERRGADRRKENKVVFLDTRCNRLRRQQDGRRWKDNNKQNKHRRGVDFYV